MVEQSLDIRVALLEERVHNVLIQFDGLDRFFTSIKNNSDLEQRVALLEQEVEVLENKIKTKVEKNEFTPVKALVFGFAAIVLVAVIGAILLSIGIKIK
jgi:hypothetical protein